jgi:soluble lytic murein transglycosylase-like protein
MIERESGYRWDATSSDGTTKGYMQIYDKWHKARMQAEGVDDIYNPYGNIRVGLNLLHELVGKCGEDYHRVLMSYNMGEAGCKNANNKGIYSTAYSRGILQRAQELKQEIQG